MNREIKFRAWDKLNKKMSEVFDLSQCNVDFGDYTHSILTIGENYSNEFIVMQYTGLKDINDQEIYEGDIVKITSKYVQFSGAGVVKYGDHYLFNEDCTTHALGFYITSLDGCSRDFISPEHELDMFFPELKILGNMYETPELLELK